MCFLQRRNRKHLYRNLETAFGDELSPVELKRLRRKIFQNFAGFVTDFLRMPLVTRENLSEFLTEGSEDTVRALGAMAGPDSPTISTTAHVGNWELGAAATGLLAGPISVLVDVHPSKLVTAFFDGRRADKGIDVVSVSSFYKSFRAMKQGHLVAIVGDRPVTGQGIRADYFGREALMPDGYAVLARRFGAQVVPTFLLMTEDGRYRFLIDEPLRARETDDEVADVRDLVERTLAVLERYIREYREQWYVFRPIWDGSAEEAVDRHHHRRRRWHLRRARTPAKDAARQN